MHAFFNGNGHGEPQSKQRVQGGIGESPQSAEQLLLQWKTLQDVIAQFVEPAAEAANEYRELKKLIHESCEETKSLRLEIRGLREGLEAVMSLIRELSGEVHTMAPLAQMAHQLRDKEMERLVVIPLVLAIIQIIDRIDQETQLNLLATEAEEVLKAGRTADRDEYLAFLAGMDIYPFAVAKRTKFHPTRHSARQAYAATCIDDEGRVRKMLLPGYERRADSLLIRPALVQVFARRASTPD